MAPDTPPLSVTDLPWLTQTVESCLEIHYCLRGSFVFEAEGMKSSPSEEFNRTMQTYTTAFVQLAQIAAAAYNPSSSGVIATKAATSSAATTSATTATAATSAATPATATTNAAECVDCKEPAK